MYLLRFVCCEVVGHFLPHTKASTGEGLSASVSASASVSVSVSVSVCVSLLCAVRLFYTLLLHAAAEAISV